MKHIGTVANQRAAAEEKPRAVSVPALPKQPRRAHNHAA